MLFTDQAAVGRALVVQRYVGHGREGRLQSRKTFRGGAGTREFLLVEGEAAVLVVDRHEALIEMAVPDRVVGALLALQRQGVDVFAGDAFEGGDGVGADALVRLRVPRAQAQVAVVHHRRRRRVGCRGRVAHHLGAAGDDQVFHAAHDLGGGEVHAGDAGAAEAVEGDAAGLDVVAGVERRHTAEVRALLAALAGGAPDDVVDVGGVEVVPLGKRLQHRGGELLRVDVGERALADLADPAGRADRVDDQSFSHRGFLGTFCCWLTAFSHNGIGRATGCLFKSAAPDRPSRGLEPSPAESSRPDCGAVPRRTRSTAEF